jgi:hypothetical protein
VRSAFPVAGSRGPDQERGEEGWVSRGAAEVVEAALGPAEEVGVSSVAVTEVAAAVLAAAMEVGLDPVPRVHVVASAAADVATEEAAEAAKAAAVLVAALVAVAGALVAVAVSGAVLLAAGSAAEVLAAGPAGSAGSDVLVAEVRRQVSETVLLAADSAAPLTPDVGTTNPPRLAAAEVVAAGLAGSAGSGVLVAAGPPRRPLSPGRPQRKGPPEEVDSGSAAAAAAEAVSETVPLEARETPGAERGGGAIRLLTWRRGLRTLVIRQCKNGSVDCAWQRAV